MPRAAPRRAATFGDFLISLRRNIPVVAVHEVPVPLMHGAALVPAQVALEGIFVRVRGLVDGVDDVVEEHASAHRAVVALHLDPGGFFVRSESHPQTGLSRLPALQSPVHVLRHRHRLGGFPSWSVVMEAQRVEVVGVI